jgi:hypothetical protein
MYNFWFGMMDTGHRVAGDQSNIQRRINHFVRNNPTRFMNAPDNGIRGGDFREIDTQFHTWSAGQTGNWLGRQDFYRMRCVYEVPGNQTTYFGDPCDPADPDTWGRPFWYRTPSRNNLFPQERALGMNWNDGPNGKGTQARAIIEAAGDGVIAQPGALEFEFIIGPNEMRQMREHNTRQLGQGGFNDFTLICNEAGRECRSTFLEAFCADGTCNPRWRYFLNGTWTTPVNSRGMHTRAVLEAIDANDKARANSSSATLFGP